MRGSATTSAARALDDHLAVVQHGDALGKAQRRVHIVLDHHDGHVARDRGEQRADGLALGLGQSGERLVEQQHFRLLRQRHGEFEPSPLAIGGLDHDPLGTVAEPDALQRLARVLVEITVGGQDRPRVPAPPVEPEQRQHHVVNEPLARKQRENLIGAREAEVHASLRGHAQEFLPEQPDRTGIGGEVAGDQVEQRGLAGPVRADDQAALARHDGERYVLRGRQAAEALAEMRDLERGRRHCAGSDAVPRAALRPLMRFCNRRHACVQPGTRPYGMNMITTTKMRPSSVFQRST